jgi:hypothetical protein
MSDMPTGPGGQGPSEEELRAALGQLRESPVDQVLAEVASALLNAAQVKLGRRDGRLLIDTVASLTGAIRGKVTAELTSQLDDVLGQLRLAQVEAEREVAQAATQGHIERNDLSVGAGDQAPDGAAASGDAAEAASPAAAADGQPAASQAPGTSSAASRLWVPGR